MKKLIVTLTALLALNTQAEENLPAEAGQPQPVSITLSSVVANKYLFSGTGGVLSENPVIQTDLFFAHKSGVYLDLWASRSLKGKWDDGSLGNEVDYGVGWNGSIKGFTAHVGVTYFDEPQSFKFGAGDILYSHVRVGKDFKPLTLTLGYENLVTMPDSGFQGGNLFSLTASKSVSFWNDRMNVSASLAGVYDTGTLGSDTGFFLRGTAGLNWNISKRLVANVVSVNYFIREKSSAMVSSGFTFNF
ncbi:MAG: TorF family putative porin [bacterium]|nr:TorF family putative porin [bacterium]